MGTSKNMNLLLKVIPFIFSVVSLVLFSAFTSDILTKNQKIEAESAELIGGAIKVADDAASGGYIVSMNKPGEGMMFTGLHAANTLAIRYASLKVGLISVVVNNQPVKTINIHSSGDLKDSFLHAKINISIPAGAVLTVSLVTNNITVNIDQILVGDGNLELPPDIWNLPPLPVAAGPYPADWKGLSKLYTVPEWWRDAKFGAWAHWDPQSMPEDGDWYARGMYIQGSQQYNYQVQHFGYPSVYGYKDIAHNWVIDRWNPNALMKLYIQMGARYFMAMGAHHDNFDCFNSKYQPWNSVNVGPKVDIVGTWEKVARKYGMPFGIGFHDTPARTWGQFMPVRYTSDKSGPMKGVPYDALQTILDGYGKWSKQDISALAKPSILPTIMNGKDKWWKGMDPVDLYGLQHTMDLNEPRSLPGNDPLRSPFANQFMWRVDDAINKYHPDILYFDEHAGDSQVDLGVHMGLGFLAPQLAANYYNKSLRWNNGKMKVVLNLKGVGGRYNSFQDHPELLSFVKRSLVRSTEAIIEQEISAYPFQTEVTSGDWHYQKGQHYLDAGAVIRLLMENVSRNGSLLLNISMHGRGNLDPQAIRICTDVGAWLKINGEAVYRSRPFEVYGEDEVCYTRNNGNVYATLLDWNGGSITLKALHTGGSTLGKVSKVEMLGSNIKMNFVQNENGLTVTPEGEVQPLHGIADKHLASGVRVLRITDDKDWINDDDPGTSAPGWIRQCNLGTGDYNNDLTISDTPGDIWSCTFIGNNISIIAPREAGSGKIEIKVDGVIRGMADLSTAGAREAQQLVYKVSGLKLGKHILIIVNSGPGPVAIDAVDVQK